MEVVEGAAAAEGEQEAEGEAGEGVGHGGRDPRWCVDGPQFGGSLRAVTAPRSRSPASWGVVLFRRGVEGTWAEPNVRPGDKVGDRGGWGSGKRNGLKCELQAVSCLAVYSWSDLNARPPDPQSGALTY